VLVEATGCYQRGTNMTKPNVRPIPDGQRTFSYLSVRDAANAIDFYKRAFGATEVMRLQEPGGKIGHAEISIDGVVVMLSDEYPDYDAVGPQTVGHTTVSILIYVEDVDAIAERAVKAGATLLRPIKTEFYGERVATLKDPFGHKWSFQARVEDLTPEEMQRRYTELVKG
jgi:PhnB protein